MSLGQRQGWPMEAQIAFGVLAVVVIAWQAYQNARLQRSLEDLVLKVLYLKGLNPAVVDPQNFGPQAMADAYRHANPTITPQLDDESEAYQAQKYWELEAAKYAREQAMADAGVRPT